MSANPFIFSKKNMNRTVTGYVLFNLACVGLLVKYYFIKDPGTGDLITFSSVIIIAGSLLLIFPFDQIIFDNHEWHPNKAVPELIVKIRLRGVLFNNISVIIFIITVLIIIAGFYILIHPISDARKEPGTETNLITIRVSATTLLIFLVQVLFRVFKYLLRVAAFYNAKADALEVFALKSEIPLADLMTMFTPDKYDISDVTTPSFLDKLTGGK
jgi:hypothetical protein